MITYKIKIGNTTVAGPTFSIENKVDVIHAQLHLKSTSSGIMHIWHTNEERKSVYFDTVNENFMTGLTLSLILQSDDPTEIDVHHENGPTACGIKDIVAEIIP